MVAAGSSRQRDVRDLVRRVHRGGAGAAETVREPVRIAAGG
jgi:hypothetical protein